MLVKLNAGVPGLALYMKEYEFINFNPKASRKNRNPVIEALKILKKHNYLIIVITNQSGVGRGFYTEKQVNDLHSWINKQLLEHKVEIDDFFFSTELPTEKIENSRRKPSPLMINEAVKKYNLVKDKCFMIGDKQSDLLAAKNASIKGFLFDGGDLSVKISKILKDHL